MIKRKYELVAIFEPDIKTEEKEKLLQLIKKSVAASGKVLEDKEWGKKELASPIKKQKMGVFCWLAFEMEAKAMVDLEKKLKLEEKIIRYLLVKE